MAPQQLLTAGSCAAAAVITAAVFLLVGEFRRIEPRPTSDWPLEREIKDYSEGIVSMSFSPDGTRLAGVACRINSIKTRAQYTGPPEGTLKVWKKLPYWWVRRSAMTLPKLTYQPIQFTSDGKSVQFIENGHIAHETGQSCLVEWDTEQLRMTSRSVTKEAAFSPISGDGRFYTYELDDGKLRVARVDNDEVVSEFQQPELVLNGRNFSHDGSRLLASGSREWTVVKLFVLDTVQGSVKCEIPLKTGNGAHAWRLSHDGRFVSIADSGSTLSLYVLETCSTTWEWETQSEHIWCAAFSPDGTRFAAGFEQPNNSDVVAKVWDVATGKVVNTNRDKKSWAVTALTFSPDSQTLATGHPDGTIRFWSPATPSENIPAEVVE